MERKKKKQWDDSRFALNHQMTKDREDRDRITELQKARPARQLTLAPTPTLTLTLT